MPAEGEAAQAGLIAFLARPESYGLPADHPVERIDTHISRVFLAGDRAYKLKRAVSYSYLDFSTVERRRAACVAELAVNRRTAPGIYLEVRPVRRLPDGGFSLGEVGEPVDWLVIMRRFPQSALLDHMAETGRIDPPLARAIAEAVADLHDHAEITRDAGGRAGIDAAFQITKDNLRRHPERLPVAMVAEWISGMNRAIERLDPLLEDRRRKGHARACHGDLHLRNICMIDDRPTLFDAIEFDPSLARSDVLYDLAFLLMDLLHRDRADLANIVLNRYLDRREETGGLAAMPMFLSLRAAIRAQIAATRPDEDALAYLTMANALLSAPPPLLIAIGGFSGCGKSMLAAALAPFVGSRPGARILRSDVIRKRLARVPETARLSADHYTADWHRAVYQDLHALSRDTVAARWSVIVDAVFGDATERADIEAVARGAGVRFIGLWLEAPSDLIEARIAARRDDASDATVAVARRQVRRGAGAIGWSRIDASGDVAATLRGARAVLASVGAE